MYHGLAHPQFSVWPDAEGSGQGRFLGTGSAALPVLAGPRVSAAPASDAIDGAASLPACRQATRPRHRPRPEPCLSHSGMFKTQGGQGIAAG